MAAAGIWFLEGINLKVAAASLLPSSAKSRALLLRTNVAYLTIHPPYYLSFGGSFSYKNVWPTPEQSFS